MQAFPGLESFARTIRLPHAGLTLYIYDAGDKHASPILLIHGLGDEADTWRHLILPLAATHRVIALDLPGFGRSDKPNVAYTIPFFQNTLIELLDTLAIQSAMLVGHSLGAIMAHAIALNHPARVNRLVLVGGALVASVQKINLVALLFLIPGLGEWLYNRLRNDPQAAYRTLAPYYHRIDDLPEADRTFLFQRVNERVWSDEQRRAFLSTLRNLVRWIPGQQRDLQSRLACSSVPTLAIWGEDDQINDAENGKALVKLQPTARLVIVPNAGHNVHQENPGAVLDALHTE